MSDVDTFLVVARNIMQRVIQPKLRSDTHKSAGRQSLFDDRTGKRSSPQSEVASSFISLSWSQAIQANRSSPRISVLRMAPGNDLAPARSKMSTELRCSIISRPSVGRDTPDVINLVREREKRAASVAVLDPFVTNKGDLTHGVTIVLGMVAQMERRFIKGANANVSSGQGLTGVTSAANSASTA